MLKSISKLAQVIRLHQWWRFKIAPAMGLFLLFQATTGAGWDVTMSCHFFLVAVSIGTAAAFTSLSNDLFDLQSDAAAGKFNRLADLSKTRRRLLLGFVASAGLMAAWAMPTATARWLYGALWANWLIYSAPPIRTKNRGAFGALSDAIGSHLLPTALVIELARWDWHTGILLPAIAIGWSLMWGLRGIVWHQLFDYHRDKQSSVNTWAVKLAPHRLQRIAVYRLFPIELALFAALSWHVPHGLLGLAAIVFAQAVLHLDGVMKIHIVEPGERLALYDWYIIGFPIWLAAWTQPWALPIFPLFFWKAFKDLTWPLAILGKKLLVLRERFERNLDQTRHNLPTNRPILIAVTQECSRTGAPLILLELLKAWRKQHNHHIVLITLRAGELDDAFKEVSDAFLVSPDPPFNMTGRALNMLRRELPKWTSDHEVRAVVNSAVSGEVAGVIGECGIPVTALVHEFATTIFDEAKIGLYHHAQRLIFPSRIVRSAFRKSMAALPPSPNGVPELHVMPQGLFPHFLEPCDGVEGLRASIGISEDAFVVLGMGTRDWRKGIDLFVMTAGFIARDRTTDGREIHFVFVGQDVTSMIDAERYTKHAMGAMELEQHVHFVDAVDDSRAWFATADAFFMSSRLDPYPCVVLEAMSAGLPVVLFEGGAGSAEFIADHGGGEVVPHLDVAAAAAVLERWAREGMADLGREAAEAVRAQADWEQYAERVWSAVHNDKRGTHRFCKFADVKAILKDVHNIQREFPRPISSAPDERPASLPPDRHQAIKALSQPVFAPNRVQARRGEVVKIATELVALIKSSDDPFDLFEGFARPYVGQVMMLYFGIPIDKMEALFEIADRLPLGIEVERLETDHEAIVSLMFADYIRVLSDVYGQQAPEGTLVSVLQAKAKEGKISFDQTRHTINSALDGSIGTTLSFVRGMLHFFACHPAHWKTLKEEPGRIPDAVEEMLRYLSPASNFLWGRATGDVAVNGCPMKRDDRVEFDIHAANRDPEVFTQPDKFVIGRKERQHLALGHGPHFCLGAALARLVAHVAIEELTKGLGELDLATTIDPPERETQWGNIPELIIRTENHSNEA